MTENVATRPPRQSSDERRDQVLDAAVTEFAATGFHATSTAAIAKRAGISQPYIYALFPNKHELFLAASKRVTNRIKQCFSEAARGAGDPEQALHQMGAAYVELLENREEIMFQLQTHAAAGDPRVREAVRKDFTSCIDHVAQVSGAGRDEVIGFMGSGMLLNVVAALDLPSEYAPGGGKK
jgi:AcrR family transcriptional regulator